MLERSEVAEIVDEVVGARRADAAASVGTYIALATAQPGRRPVLQARLFPTGGRRPPATGWCACPPRALDHRRFWEAMDADQRGPSWPRSSGAIVARMVEAFELDLSGLVLDMTNFATYIDSANERAPIAQRGHAKQKRTDLRLVGLGLVVSTDGGVPLVSHAYAGQPPRRHPVRRRWSTSSWPASSRWRGDARRAHPGLRRRAELRGQLRAVRGLTAALRRLAATV